jgi:hypothetical protein
MNRDNQAWVMRFSNVFPKVSSWFSLNRSPVKSWLTPSDAVLFGNSLIQ